MARFRVAALAAVFLALLACSQNEQPESAPLKLILHGSASQTELLDITRSWLINKGVDVLYVQTDAKEIYNKSVLVARTTDVVSRQRLIDLTGVGVWVWGRQEKPSAPFELYIGDDIQNLMDRY